MRRARDLAGAGALLCGTAALLAIPSLLIPGIAALVAAAIAPAWTRAAIAGASLRLRLTPPMVQEDEPLPITVEVRRGPVPFPGRALLRWREGDGVALPPRRRSELSGTVSFARRGRHALGPVSLSTADPLGIAARELTCEEREVLVLPRVLPIAGRALDLLGARGGARPDSTPEVDSLRSHQPGSPATRIHWPTVARTGELMERALTREADPRVLVMLDTADADSEEALDRALRATASLCVHLARRSGCLLLLPGDRRASAIAPDLRTWPALHARLALLDGAAAAGVWEPGPGGPQTRVYVTACSVGSPPPGGRCYRVAPNASGDEPAAFAVAGLAVELVRGGTAAGAAV